MGSGLAILWSYYLVTLLAVPIALKALTRAPDEVVRKVQHVAYALSIFLLLGLFERWTQALAAVGGLALLAFPALWLWERHASYRRLLTDRSARGGEMRRQLLLAVLVFSVLIASFWGWLGPAWRPAIAVVVMVWGFGDAAAALVGRFRGRRRVVHRLIEGAKTIEGTVAMVVAGAIAAFVTLIGYGEASWWVSLLAALSLAPVAAAVELFSRRGSDTVTVPLATAAGLVPWWLVVVASRA
jgi:phytol kinase